MSYKIHALIKPQYLLQWINRYEQNNVPKHRLKDFFQSLILTKFLPHLSQDYHDIAAVLIKNKVCFNPVAINDNIPLEQSNKVSKYN